MAGTAAGPDPGQGAALTVPLRKVAILAWFDGIAALRWAFKFAQAQVVCYCSWEIDQEAIDLIAAHFSEAEHLGDFRGMSAAQVLGYLRLCKLTDDVLVVGGGGPPASTTAARAVPTPPAQLGRRAASRPSLLSCCLISRNSRHGSLCTSWRGSSRATPMMRIR